MKKRNLKKGVAIELALLVLIIVTFASALILSLAVVATKEKNDAYASLQERVYMEEVVKDILIKRYLNYGDGNWIEEKFVYGDREYIFTKTGNEYALEVGGNEYDVNFERGDGNNKILKISKEEEILLTAEVTYDTSNNTITIISWQY